MKKRITCLAASVIAFSLAAGNVGYAAGGWSQQNGNWYYTNRDGMFLTRQMTTIDSQKFAFDESGVMVHNAWYYNNEDGKWYYMDSNGVAKKGWMQVGSKWYYLLSSGAMANDGWRTIEGTRYYFDEDGIMKQNGFVGEKYLDSAGVNDSRYDIKVKGKIDKGVLEDAGDMTENVPGWLLQHIFDSGWKIACNAEKEDYGSVKHEDYSSEYTKYCQLESGRKLIFFTQQEYILQGIGLYVNNAFGKPGTKEDFQGAFSVDWDRVSNMFPQQPIIEKSKDMAFAEVFALYYSENEDVRQRFREDCPALCEYMDYFMAECYGNASVK